MCIPFSAPRFTLRERFSVWADLRRTSDHFQERYGPLGINNGWLIMQSVFRVKRVLLPSRAAILAQNSRAPDTRSFPRESQVRDLSQFKYPPWRREPGTCRRLIQGRLETAREWGEVGNAYKGGRVVSLAAGREAFDGALVVMKVLRSFLPPFKCLIWRRNRNIS